MIFTCKNVFFPFLWRQCTQGFLKNYANFDKKILSTFCNIPNQSFDTIHKIFEKDTMHLYYFPERYLKGTVVRDLLPRLQLCRQMFVANFAECNTIFLNRFCLFPRYCNMGRVLTLKRLTIYSDSAPLRPNRETAIRKKYGPNHFN